MRRLLSSLSNFFYVILLFLSVANTSTCQSLIPKTDLTEEKKVKDLSLIKKFSIAIGEVTDSASSLSRSFALCKLINNGIFRTDQNDTLHAFLSDYPYTAQYGITGTFFKDRASFKLFKSGRKVKELETKNDWKDFLENMERFFAMEGYTAKKRVDLPVEGGRYKVRGQSINNVLPGKMESDIPISEIADSFKSIARIQPFKFKSLYDVVTEVYGKYGSYNENDLFFFRNDNVPANLKSTIRSIVFPSSKWLAPTLTYITGGQLFYEKKEYGTSLNAFYSALRASDALLISSFEQSVLKSVTFSKIANIYELNEDAAGMSRIYRLAENLNKAYLSSGKAIQDRTIYYSQIASVQSICDKAESNAKSIRASSRMGIFTALVNTGAAVASISPMNNGTSDMFMQEASTALEQTSQQTTSARNILNEQLKEVENSIDAKSFIEENNELGSKQYYVANEFFKFLYHEPEIVKNVVFDFAKDKPTLKSLLTLFYSGEDKSKTLRLLTEHISNIEEVIIKYESRNLRIPSNLISRF